MPQQFMFDALDNQKEHLSDLSMMAEQIDKANQTDIETTNYTEIAEKMNTEGYNVTPEYLKEIDRRTQKEWEGGGKIDSAADALAFIFAGNAYFTLLSLKTGTRYTYRIARPKRAREKEQWFYYVSLLSGPDNTSNYTYMGWMTRDHDRVTIGGNAHLKPGTPSVVALDWAIGKLKAGVKLENFEIWHEGRCGRCGRRLTVPSSIAAGIGPECAGKVGLS